MPDIKICEYNIEFPYEPYNCQYDYMEKVIRTLSLGTNAILESPTGTGKTLCLLCAILGWQKSQLQNYNKIPSDEKNPSQQTSLRPKFQIYYLARTHSQLQQVVKELRKTNYNVKMTILGSRERLCIDDKVRLIENNVTRNLSCKNKVKNGQCRFYKNINSKDPVQMPSSFNIEDAVASCRSSDICPYYYVRNLAERSNLIIAPYNYILDQRNMKSNLVDLKNSIVIIDEAHNIERVFEDGFSVELSDSDVLKCLNEIEKAIQLAREHALTPFDDNELPPSIPREDDLTDLKKSLILIQNKICSFKNNSKNCVFSHSDAINFLIEAKFDHSCIVQLSPLIDSLIEFLSFKGIQVNTFGIPFSKLSDFVFFIFKSQNYVDKLTSRYFRLCVNIKSHENPQKSDVILKFLCFSPSIVLQTIIGYGTHSIIMTSGTLSPIDSFEKELRLPNALKLENQHIATLDQIKLYPLKKGCDESTILSSRFENRANKQYLHILGQTILDIISLIPGGVLVFFPSYPALEIAHSEWSQTNLISKLKKIKKLFIETKDDFSFKKSTRAFLNNKDRASLFLAVCRGKLSEGYDFSDNYARAVIITGLPYPSKTDYYVKLKMEVLNKIDNSGSEWYNRQAMMAVNQAIGRVYRHRNDFGLVFLLDERFSFQSTQSQLSKWVQKHIQDIKTFKILKTEISKFFLSKNCINPPLHNLPFKKKFSENSEKILDYYINSKENIPIYKTSSDHLIKKLEEKSKIPLSLAYPIKSYPSEISLSSKIKLKCLKGSPKTIHKNKAVVIANLSEDLKKILKKDDYIIFYSSLKQYLENKNIFQFFEQITPILSFEMFRKLEDVIPTEHQTVFKAFMDDHFAPKPLEAILTPKQEPNFKCGKCSHGAPYRLPCGHDFCSRCYAESAHSGLKCLLCKSKYKIEEVQERYCNDN